MSETIEKPFKLTKPLALKVLSTVDAGLCSGVGEPIPGKMCVEAAVCYAMGLPHSDKPTCVSTALRSLKIQLNDSNWSSYAARAKGLRRLAIAQLGSEGNLDEREFVDRVIVSVVKNDVAKALRAAASIHPQKLHSDAMIKCAEECESVDGKSAAARDAADDADAADAAVYAARHESAGVQVSVPYGGIA